MAVLEAMAAGLPVIISQTVGAGDLVVNGIEGFVLKEPPSSAELSEKIECLLNEENRLKMGEHARKQALKYSWNRIADRMAALYLKNLSLTLFIPHVRCKAMNFLDLYAPFALSFILSAQWGKTRHPPSIGLIF